MKVRKEKKTNITFFYLVGKRKKTVAIAEESNSKRSVKYVGRENEANITSFFYNPKKNRGSLDMKKC